MGNLVWSPNPTSNNGQGEKTKGKRRRQKWRGEREGEGEEKKIKRAGKKKKKSARNFLHAFFPHSSVCVFIVIFLLTLPCLACWRSFLSWSPPFPCAAGKNGSNEKKEAAQQQQRGEEMGGMKTKQKELIECSNVEKTVADRFHSAFPTGR